MKIHVPDKAIPIIYGMNTQNEGFGYQFIHADVKCKLYCMYHYSTCNTWLYSLILRSV